MTLYQLKNKSGKKKKKKKKKKIINNGDIENRHDLDSPDKTAVKENDLLEEQLVKVVDKARKEFKEKKKLEEASLIIFYLRDLMDLLDTSYCRDHLSSQFANKLDDFVGLVINYYPNYTYTNVLLWMRLDFRKLLTGSIIRGDVKQKSKIQFYLTKKSYEINSEAIRKKKKEVCGFIHSHISLSSQSLSIKPLLHYLKISEEWGILFEELRNIICDVSSCTKPDPTWIPIYSLYGVRVTGENVILISPDKNYTLLLLESLDPKELVPEFVIGASKVYVYYNGEGISINKSIGSIPASSQNDAKKNKGNEENLTEPDSHSDAVIKEENISKETAGSGSGSGSGSGAEVDINTEATPNVLGDLHKTSHVLHESFIPLIKDSTDKPDQPLVKNKEKPSAKESKPSDDTEQLAEHLEKLTVNEQAEDFTDHKTHLTKALQILGVDNKSKPRAISVENALNSTIQEAVDALSFCKTQRECRLLHTSLSAVQLRREGWMANVNSEHLAKWTVQVIVPLMELADDYYPAAEMLARILPTLNTKREFNIFLHYPYLIKLFHYWKGRKSKPVFHISPDELLDEDTRAHQTFRNNIKGVSTPKYQKTGNTAMAELWKVAFQVFAQGGEQYETWASIIDRTRNSLEKDDDFDRLWGFLFAILQSAVSAESLKKYGEILMDEIYKFKKEEPGSDVLMQIKSTMRNQERIFHVNFVTGIYDSDVLMVFALAKFNLKWLKTIEEGLETTFFLSSLDDNVRKGIIPVLMARVWSLYQKPDLLRKVGRYYEERDGKDKSVAAAYLNKSAKKWESSDGSHENKHPSEHGQCSLDLGHIEQADLITLQGEEGNLEEDQTEEVLQVVESLEQITGVKHNLKDGGLPDRRVARYQSSNRKFLADWFLWEVLKDMKPRIVTYLPLNRKMLRLHWHFSPDFNSQEDQNKMGYLFKSSQLGNGIADLVLALCYSVDNKEATGGIRKLNANRGVKIMLHLRRAALRGQVQALSWMFQIMINNPCWADVTGLMSLAVNGFSSGQASMAMPIELINGEETKPGERIYSISPGDFKFTDNVELAETLVKIGKEKKPHEQCAIMTGLLKRVVSRVAIALPNANLREEYSGRVLLLHSLARQIPCSLCKLLNDLKVLPQQLSIQPFRLLKNRAGDAVKKIIQSCDDYDDLEHRAVESINDTAQIVELMLRVKGNWPAFRELWEIWRDEIEKYYRSSHQKDDIDEEFFEIISGTGPLSGLSSIVMALRLNEYRKELVGHNYFSQKELDHWIKHLLWRGVELGSADAAKYWFEWYGEEDEPGMARLAVDRYIAKIKILPEITEDNRGTLVKFATLVNKIRDKTILGDVRAFVLSLNLEDLDIKDKMNIQKLFGFNISPQAIVRQLLDLVDDEAIQSFGEIVNEIVLGALHYKDISLVSVEDNLKILKDFIPGQLERDNAELVVGNILVSLARAFPYVIGDKVYRVPLEFWMTTFIEPFLCKASELGNKDADLIRAGLNKNDFLPLKRPIEKVEARWLEKVLIPLAFSAEKNASARKHLAHVLLSYPDLRHLPTLVALYCSDDKEYKGMTSKQLPHFLDEDGEDMDEQLVQLMAELENLGKSAVQDPGENQPEAIQLMAAHRYLFGVPADQQSQYIQSANVIINRNLAIDPQYKHEWEYLKSVVAGEEIIYHNESEIPVAQKTFTDILHKYFNEGNSNYNLQFIGFMFRSGALSATDLLAMEQVACTAFSVDHQATVNMELLPVQLICLSSIFFHKPKRLMKLALSYLKEANNSSVSIEAAEEKALYLFQRAADCGEDAAHHVLCAYWKQRNHDIYRKHIWKFGRYAYNLALAQGKTLPVIQWICDFCDWLDREKSNADSDFGKAQEYFLGKIFKRMGSQ